MSTVRARFAPSPTGYLHIGGVRTALYSWLYAKQHGGTFVLRIEDTDRDRSTDESTRIVLESMHWLGLDYQEGPDVGGPHAPYFQSKRLATYAEYAERLIASGHAYRCYATKEELAAAREAHAKTGAKEGFRFESPWREAKEPPKDPNAPHVIRFKSPRTGKTGWDDMVKGHIEVPNDAQQDFVLLRPDGMPLYNFGCVVDDLTMGITHVCRGDDHVVNTPPQILLYEALGATPPTFGHLPMVLAPNGEKLSKRHAAVGVLEYRDMGYLPDAVLNYLARLGWSHGDQEIFTREELVQKFDWNHVGSTAGKYDAKKFAFVQTEHLRRAIDASLEDVVRRALPFYAKAGIVLTADDPRIRPAIRSMKNRVNTLIDLVEWTEYYFRAPTIDPKAKEKFLVPASAATLREMVALLSGAEPFDQPTIDAKVQAWLASTDRKIKDVAPPARVSLIGRAHGGLFEVMEVLGRDETIARLEAGIALCEGA